MMKFCRVLAFAVASCAFSALPPVWALAADVPAVQAIVIGAGETDQILRYVKKRAILHLIRATFDVVPAGDVPKLIADDARKARTTGVSSLEIEQLDLDLLTEGSYFLVSLRYLIEAGFPNWPQDRSESTYREDSLAILGPLDRQLLAAIEAGDDPLPIFETAAKVYWWTEGAQQPNDAKAEFALRDSLVDAVMAHETGP